MNFTGTAGNDVIRGTRSDDNFDLSQGGNDTALGKAGDDIFNLGAAFNADDEINGGRDGDTLSLYGDYSAGVVFTPHTLTNVEQITVSGPYVYNLTTNDATVASGAELRINVTNDGSRGYALLLNGSAETDGHFSVIGGEKNDVLIGGDKSDSFASYGTAKNQGGDDTFDGQGGKDTFFFNTGIYSGFTANDKIDGGTGNDTVYLGGETVVFNKTTMVNVETIVVSSTRPTSLTTANATVASGHTLKVDASALTGDQTLTFDGHHERDGHFVLIGGAGSDVLRGGQLSDTIWLTHGGLDTLNYHQIALSGATRDIVHGFNFDSDVIKFAAVTGIDPVVTTGSVSSASFDSDLTALFGAGQTDELGANHAVLFTADGGDLSGHTFLIVDGDGTAGYLSGHDLVIELSSPLNTDDIGTNNFTA